MWKFFLLVLILHLIFQPICRLFSKWSGRKPKLVLSMKIYMLMLLLSLTIFNCLVLTKVQTIHYTMFKYCFSLLGKFTSERTIAMTTQVLGSKISDKNCVWWCSSPILSLWMVETLWSYPFIGVQCTIDIFARSILSNSRLRPRPRVWLYFRYGTIRTIRTRTPPKFLGWDGTRGLKFGKQTY